MADDDSGLHGAGSSGDSPQLTGFRKRWADRTQNDGSSTARHDSDRLEARSDFSLASCKRICVESDATAQELALQTFRRSDVKLPWQQGPLACLFGGRSAYQQFVSPPAMTRVGIQDVLTGATLGASGLLVDSTVNAKPLHKGSLAAKRISASKFVHTDDELRVKALNQFKVMLCTDLAATRVGSTLVDMAGRLDESVDL